MKEYIEKRLAAGLCTRCGKEPARENHRTCAVCAEKMHEINKRRYARKKTGLEPPPKETLCFSCKHAVPTLDGRFGCEWSKRFQPVPGWEAEKTKKFSGESHGKRRYYESYFVTKCPKFIEG